VFPYPYWMRRLFFGIFVAAGVVAAACGSDENDDASGATGDAGTDAPVGPVDAGSDGDGSLSEVVCDASSPTTLTGKVLDPAGKRGISNVLVYVPPGNEPAPLTDGPSCDPCNTTTSSATAFAVTDATGAFTIANVPANADFPLVVQIGKWRRTTTIAKLTACSTTAVETERTRLPKNRAEGHLPRIALSTGGADSIECLLRDIGVDDSEFGLTGSEARIHLFGGTDGTKTFSDGGASFPASTTLWGELATLSKYDLVVLGCEGSESAATKPQTALVAMYEYAKNGGRIFAGHWQRYWLSDSLAPEVRALATWDDRPDPSGPIFGTINTTTPSGHAFSDWLADAGALGSDGKMALVEVQDVVAAVGPNAQSLMTFDNGSATPDASTGHAYFTASTPVGATPACGRIAYTTLHMSNGDTIGGSFPSGCTDTELSPQIKALEYALFDVGACNR
jgi:hypothetical protein